MSTCVGQCEAPALARSEPVESPSTVATGAGTGSPEIDVAEISPEAQALAAIDPEDEQLDAAASENDAEKDDDEAEDSMEAETRPRPGELSDAELQQVRELSQRDHEVRMHEQAHKAVAGPYALGGPVYEYERGPDGKRYAVGGHVKIDTSEAPTPEQTLAKAQVIRRAALAPAQPSAADRAIAAQAAMMANQAQLEIRQQTAEELQAAQAVTEEVAAVSAAQDQELTGSTDPRDVEAVRASARTDFQVNLFAQHFGFAG